MHSKVRFQPNERIDYPDLVNIAGGYVEEEFDILHKYLLSGNSAGHIVKGFELNEDSGLIVDVTVEDLVCVTPSGRMAVYLSTEPQLTLAMADNATNYVEVQTYQDNETNESRVFWDADGGLTGEGEEFAQNIDVLTKQYVRLVVNQIGFSGDSDKVPVGIVVTNSGVIERIHDNYANTVLTGSPADPTFPESKLFRLNDSDNDGDTNRYDFGSPRTDTSIETLKEMFDAFASQIKDIIGDGHTTAEKSENDWFDERPTDLFACNQDRNSQLHGGGNVSFTSSTGAVAFTADFIISIPGLGDYNNIPTSESPLTVADGQAAYVSLNRDASVSANLSVTVAAIASVPSDKDVFVLCKRSGNSLYMADGTRLEDGNNTLLGMNDSLPLGSIIPFHDFGALTFDTAKWAYCDGGNVTIAGASYTTEDMSGRYLVGFGSDGGNDIDTALWSGGRIAGNAGHTIDIYHRHSIGHTHQYAHTHEHTHTHSDGTLVARLGPQANNFTTHDWVAHMDTVAPEGEWVANYKHDSDSGWGTSFDTFVGSQYAHNGVSENGKYCSAGIYVEGDTGGVSDDATTDSQNTSTTTGQSTNYSGYSESATQSIQPRSVKVRYLIKIA